MSVPTMSLPRVVVARALDAAQRAGTFVAASAPGFGEVLAWAGVTEVALLGLLAQRAPARAFGITGGLMRGLYVLPAGGAEAWWVRHDAAALPALGLDDGSTFDVCLSYASEDLHAAIALRDALLGAGLRVYLLDVRTDPNDPVWWLRYASAMAVSTWFVPLLSRHYLERAGSEVEAAEARAHAVAIASSTPWHPILPAWLEDGPVVAREAGPWLVALPGRRARTEAERADFARWVAAVRIAARDQGAALRAELGGWGAVEGGAARDVDAAAGGGAGGVVDADLTFLLPHPVGAPRRVRVAADGSARLLDLPDPAAPTPLGARGAVPEEGRLLIRVKELRDAGRGDEAAAMLARSALAHGVDASLAISLAESLERVGVTIDAWVAWEEAAKQLNPNHTERTHALVEAGLARLAEPSRWARGRGFAEMVTRWASRPEAGARPRFPTTARAEAACAGAKGIRDFWTIAGDAHARGELDLAEEVLMAAANWSAGPPWRELRMAAKMAGERGAVDRAVQHLLVAIDFGPGEAEVVELALAVWAWAGGRAAERSNGR